MNAQVKQIAAPARNTKVAAKVETSTEAKKSVFQTKWEAFMAALVKEYGEGTVISRPMLLKVHAKNPEAYPHPAALEKSENHRVARGMVIITTNDAKAPQMRDKEIARRAKDAEKLQAQTVKQGTKIANTSKNVKAKSTKTKAKAAQSKSVALVA